MKISPNQDSHNNLNAQAPFVQAISARQTRRGRFTLSNMFVALLVTFVAVAAMQAYQLNGLLSDTRALGRDVVELRTAQEKILDEYTSFKNNVSTPIRN